MLAVSIPALIFADKWGRRASVITGGVLLSSCMILIGVLYAAGSVHSYGNARWVVVALIFIFALSYVATWAIVGKIYASEIQPAKTRAAANSVAQGLSFFTNWLVAFATPVLLAKSAYAAYFLFGGLAFFTLAVLFVYMPETKGHPLESIQDAFQNMPSLAQRLSSLAPWRRGCGRPVTSQDTLGNDGALRPQGTLSEIELRDVGDLLRLTPSLA